MRNERVLVTGCGGMLGNAIYPYFVQKYDNVIASDRDVSEPWLMSLDVRDEKLLVQVFSDFKPDIVLHLAAETSLEFCETNSDIARDTNALAVGTIARLCAVYNSTLVYISTAGVFDGLKDGFYTEFDKPRPIMVYGRTKYEGELLAAACCPRTYVVRAGWMMGGGREKEKKFIYKILQQVENGRSEIFAVDDLWGTPTYTHDFAMNLFSLLETKQYGTYHMVCEGAGTRYDVAMEILRICRRNDINLTPVKSDFFNVEYFVRRPRSEMMINSNLRKIGCHQMRDWNIALREYIEQYFSDFISSAPVSEVQDMEVLAEKRRKERHRTSFNLSCNIQNDSSISTFTGKSIDFSEEGICMMTDREILPHSIVTIRVPSVEQWQQGAMVRWSEKKGSNYLIGLKYLETTAKFLGDSSCDLIIENNNYNDSLPNCLGK